MNEPSVAVVILNFNGKSFLEQFLPSVLATDYSNSTIYVADNGSSDDSLAFVQETFTTVKTLDLKENWGFAEGYNKALKQITADYYVLLNSDVEVTNNWIHPMVELLESDRTIAAAQPLIRMHGHEHLFEYAGAAGGWIDKLGYPFCRGRIFDELEEDKGQYSDTTEVFWATGAALFIRAELYHNLGGLDGDFFAHMEEIDLCWRLKRAGYKIMVCPESVVYHVGGGTLPKTNPRKTFLNFRNSLITLAKNEPASKLLWLIPTRLALDGVAGVKFVKEGKLKDCWAIIRAHFAFYGSFLKTMKKRRIFKEVLEIHRIAPLNKIGIFQKSILVQFFLRGKKHFSDLQR